MDTTKKRRKYTAEFKREVLDLLTKQDKTQEQIEKDLGIPHGNISRWKKELKESGFVAFRGNGKIRPIDEELIRLRKELEIARRERDLLKKAVGIVSRESE